MQLFSLLKLFRIFQHLLQVFDPQELEERRFIFILEFLQITSNRAVHQVVPDRTQRDVLLDSVKRVHLDAIVISCLVGANVLQLQLQAADRRAEQQNNPEFVHLLSIPLR